MSALESVSTNNAGSLQVGANPSRLDVSRRAFLKGTGVLLVSFSLADPARLFAPPAAIAQGAAPPRPLDAWLTIAEDNSVTLFTGEVDLGTGVKTALSQIAAEELDVPMASLHVVQGDTARTVDQGPTVGSQSIPNGGSQIRQAAAEARQVLLGLAAEHWGVPATDLTVVDGVVSARSDPSRRITYGELLGGRRFEVTVTGQATPKSPSDYRLVGQSVPRVDIPAKITGQFQYVQDVRLRGMLHARVVRPNPQSGATLVAVDEGSVGNVPGLVQVVVRGNLVAVVAEREEQALAARRQLRVTWSPPADLPAQDRIFDVVRNAESDDRLLSEAADIGAALSGAARTVQATYEFPFQSHGMMGPACCVADVRDGQATVWSGTQAPHLLQADIARELGLDREAVRVIYTEGSGRYGRYRTDDAALDAALISQAVGRPVRVQWMRADEHGWDHYNPAGVFDLRGGLDAQGNVVAFDYQVWTAKHTGQRLLGGQTGGGRVLPLDPNFIGHDTPMFYEFPNHRYLLHAQGHSVLRNGNNRSLGGLPSGYAGEAFMDELAAAAGKYPVEFRLRYLHEERAIDVLKAAAERAGWDTRPSPRPGTSRTGVARGRGVAVGDYGPTWVAMVAEVEVDQDRGRLRVPRMVVAHDCQAIINPDGVRNQVEGNVLQSLSRTLHEEVTWDQSGVTSLDWRGYPILTFSEVPDVEVVLINLPNMPPGGAGEAATVPTTAAIANAVFDATGIRLRRVPFTPERVQAALRQRQG